MATCSAHVLTPMLMPEIGDPVAVLRPFASSPVPCKTAQHWLVRGMRRAAGLAASLVSRRAPAAGSSLADALPWGSAAAAGRSGAQAPSRLWCAELRSWGGGAAQRHEAAVRGESPGCLAWHGGRGYAAAAGGDSQTPPSSSPWDESPACYTRVGRVEGPFTVPPRDVFAVVQAGSYQFKVTLDDLITVEKVKGVDINDKARVHARSVACVQPLTPCLSFARLSQVQLSRVLMLGNTTCTVVGRPFVPGCSVTVVVEEHLRDAKAIIFKKRRRKSSRRLTGHRQQLTALRVVEINDEPLRLAGGAGGGAAPAAAAAAGQA